MAKQAERNPFNIAHRQFARLKERAVDAGVPANNIQLVNDVTEIPSLEPYANSNGRIDTISDLDNVWVGWKNRSLREKTDTSQALISVIKNSSRFSLWSSRICAAETNSHLARQIEDFLRSWAGVMGAFPFFPQADKDWLNKRAANANPNCQLDYELGLGKLTNQSETFDSRVAGSLEYGAVVMIGSSTFDRRRVSNVLETVAQSGPNNFYYYDTGGILL